MVFNRYRALFFWKLLPFDQGYGQDDMRVSAILLKQLRNFKLEKHFRVLFNFLAWQEHI